MSENKTKPTQVNIETFLDTVSDQRRQESLEIINIMQQITGEKPVMWGPSIIGFGSVHYKYDTGREGDMPLLGFSPRKASITIYFSEGFHHYKQELEKLGKFKSSVSCLYIGKLEDVDTQVLKQMLQKSYQIYNEPLEKPTTVEAYIDQIPAAARSQFDELRALVKSVLPKASEVLSYGILGYKIDDKRARVYVSGWKDHVAMYPTPNDEALQKELQSYVKGKGTLWFPLDKPLPADLIKKAVVSLAS